MGLAGKLLTFVGINLAIAGLAAMAPPSLTNGIGYERHAVVFDYVESVAPGARVSIVLGDSRPECCLNAASIGFVNLSIAGGTPVEGYYLLSRLLERGVTVERLVLSFGAFHIYGQDSFNSQTRYFGLVDKAYIEEILEQAETHRDSEYLAYDWQAVKVLDENLPFLSDAMKFRLVNVLSIDRVIAQLWDAVVRNVFASEERPRLVSDPRFKLTEATPAKAINTSTEAPGIENPNGYSPLNEMYLAKIVETARAENIATGYLVMPFNQDVLHPDPEYYERFYAELAQAGLVGCVSGGDWWPNHEFSDAHHLNDVGTARFNAHLASRLRFCQW